MPKEKKMKYEISYVLPNGTKFVYGKIEKIEKGQYLASYGSPHKTAFKTLAAAIAGYEAANLLESGSISAFTIETIE